MVAAEADGLFAACGLDVEVLDPAPREENVKRVADGGSDFCITGVHHYLNALHERADLAARFVAVIGRRHTIGALVRADSTYRRPADLVGRRLGGQADSHLVRSFQQGMSAAGLQPLDLVKTEEPAAALGRGEIDAIAATVDTRPRNERQAGVPLAAIPLETDVYMSGLVAGDWIPDELAVSMIHAVGESVERQRTDPTRGLEQLLARYPDVRADDAKEGWRAVEPYLAPGDELRSVNAGGWARTVSFTCSALAISEPRAALQVFRWIDA